MWHVLERRDYARVRPVFTAQGHHLAIESTLRGFTPARIVVDDAVTPRSAFLRFKGRAWLAGESDNDAFAHTVRALIAGTSRRERRSRGAQQFLLYPSERWWNRLPGLLTGVRWTKRTRHYYQMALPPPPIEPDAPDGVALHPVDVELLASADYAHLNAVTAELRSERASIADFLAKSFGYCAVQTRVIVGWCTSEYNVEHRCELGIYTVAAHRRQGIATPTAAAVLRHAHAHGITQVGWHC